MSNVETKLNNSAIHDTLIFVFSLVILFAGVFGHLANIFVLIRLKIFRHNPSVFYLITESILDLCQLIIPFTSRIVIDSFHTDLTLTSLPWCKFRYIFVNLVSLIFFSTICFASVTQFLSTSHYPYLRQLNTIRLARILLLSATIISLINSIPYAILFEIRPTSGCSVYNYGLLVYMIYVNYFVLGSFLPMLLSSLSSVLAYQNVRRIVRRRMPIRRRKLDRQLTAMILARVAFFILTQCPYVLMQTLTFIYMNHGINVTNQSIVNLINEIVTLLVYVNYSGSFYLFLSVSARYRRQVRITFVHKFWHIYCRRQIQPNQVAPITRTELIDKDLNS